MNTWGYIVLIAMLAMLAGLMVYARLRMMAKEKSSHHTPVEPRISTVAEEKESEFSSEDTVAPVPAPQGDTAEEVSEEEVHDVEVVVTPVCEKATDPSRKEESDYIDELQEAAAGLAALMRSSPVSRAQPVVFAPETGEEEVEGEAEATAIPAEPAAGKEEAGELDLAASGETEDEVREEVAESEVTEFSLCELFGEEVGVQFESIDDGLDALEDLVAGLESSLAILNPVEDEWEDSSLEAA